ncbi:unnamed protein product [Pedinophyceae sp. YPF-701]|nr:unnamed protein product [Pedinophyceae sp. YPF-701]
MESLSDNGAGFIGLADSFCNDSPPRVTQQSMAHPESMPPAMGSTRSSDQGGRSRGHSNGGGRNSTGTRLDARSHICFEFCKGLCRRGARCKFSHDIATIVAVNSQYRGVCFDFARGECTRGVLCKFSHDPGVIAHALAGQAAAAQPGPAQPPAGIPAPQHDAAQAQARRRGAPVQVCVDFLSGHCNNGTACRLSHDLRLVQALAMANAPHVHQEEAIRQMQLSAQQSQQEFQARQHSMQQARQLYALQAQLQGLLANGQQAPENLFSILSPVHLGPDGQVLAGQQAPPPLKDHIQNGAVHAVPDATAAQAQYWSMPEYQYLMPAPSAGTDILAQRVAANAAAGMGAPPMWGHAHGASGASGRTSGGSGELYGKTLQAALAENHMARGSSEGGADSHTSAGSTAAARSTTQRVRPAGSGGRTPQMFGVGTVRSAEEWRYMMGGNHPTPLQAPVPVLSEGQGAPDGSDVLSMRLASTRLSDEQQQ